MSTLFVSIYAGLWLCVNVANLLVERDPNLSTLAFMVKGGISLLTLMNLAFPFALYKSLVADTKYWRGLGKYNKRGFGTQLEHGRPMGGSIGPMSSLDVTQNVQRMMVEDDDIIIDFCYLKLDSMIGSGATAKVYKGFYKKRPVAIKIFQPPEITGEGA